MNYKLTRACFRSLLALATLLGFFLTDASKASTELDRMYSLETVAALRSVDNVDGLFVEYVKSVFAEYFSRQTRFIYQDFSKADSVLSRTKLPYSKVITDNELLATATQHLHVQTLIRTQIVKQGANYQFTLEWLHSPKMEVLASDTFSITEKKEAVANSEIPNSKNGIGDIGPPMMQALDRLIAKVPFYGHLTGRDGNIVTVNIGAIQGLRRGDVLTASTLEEVRRHPLLNTVVDWRFFETGQLVVDHVDEGIAFCKIIEEIPGRQLMRYQKISQIRARPRDASVYQNPNAEPTPEPTEAVSIGSPQDAKLGWVGANLWTGLYSRSITGVTLGKTGSGFLAGPRIEGQFWVMKFLFLEAGISYGFTTYGQTDVGKDQVTPISTTSALQYQLAVGASYLVNGSLRGPLAFVRTGYRSLSINMPNSATELAGPSAVRSIFLGFGGDLPIKTPTAIWGGQIAFDLGIIKFVPNSDVFPTGDASDVAEISFSLGGYYRYNQRFTFRVVFDVRAHSYKASDYLIDQKIFALQPSATYHF